MHTVPPPAPPLPDEEDDDVDPPSPLELTAVAVVVVVELAMLDVLAEVDDDALVATVPSVPHAPSTSAAPPMAHRIVGQA